MKQAIDGANRWTGRCHCADSQFARQHLQREELLVRKQGMGSKEVDQALEITEDFDSLEYPACLCN